MFCKQCGFKLDEDSKFCGKCGLAIRPTESDSKTKPINKDIFRIDSKKLKKHCLLALAILIWTVSAIFMIFVYIANHNYAHGPSYPTGDIVCLNDDRGPCEPEYKEDISNLDVPNWVKFFKENNIIMFPVALILVGIVTYYMSKEEEK